MYHQNELKFERSLPRKTHLLSFWSFWWFDPVASLICLSSSDRIWSSQHESHAADVFRACDSAVN